MRIPRHVLPFAVTTAAALVSARHIYAVAYEAHNPPWAALLHAIAIDGLIYIGVYAMQDGRRIRGAIALTYGMIVSGLFNADSYGKIAMDGYVMAFAIPVAVLVGYLAASGQDTPRDAGHGTGHGTGRDTATRTELDVHLRRDSVPVSHQRPVSASRPTDVPASQRPVPMSQPASVPASVPRPVVTGEVVRPALERRPSWNVAEAERLIAAGGKGDREIARLVFGQSAGDAERKRVERLRRNLGSTH